MSTAVAERAAMRTALVPGPRRRSVLALSLVEGRRLITHPALLVGSGLIAVMIARGPDTFRFFFVSGLGYFVIGVGTFGAANLCASRSRRDRTEELFSSLPLRAADRTAAQLLAVAAPLAATLVIASVLAATTRPWEGASVRLDIEPRTIMHGLADFGQGPLAIAFLGVAGVALARWFATAVAVPVLIAGIVAINSLTGLSPGALRWLNPAANYSSAGLVSASVMPWHLVYGAGLILLLGLVGLARRPWGRGIQIYGAAAIALASVGGVMQVLAASP